MKNLNQYLRHSLKLSQSENILERLKLTKDTKILLNNNILDYVCQKFLLGSIDYINKNPNKIFKQILNDIETWLKEKNISSLENLDGPYLYSNCENLINNDKLKEYKKIDHKLLIIWSKMNNYKRKVYEDEWTIYELYLTEDMICIEDKSKSEDYFTYIIFKTK